MRAFKTIRQIRRRARASVTWALVPLAVFFCRPSSGCICADGQYEPFCSRQADASASDHDAADLVGRSCCSGHSSDSAGSFQRECVEQVDGSPSGGKQTFGAKPCCSPVAQAVAVKSSSTVVPIVDDGGQGISSCDVPVAAHGPRAVARLREVDVGPSSDDLVVTLRRFLI